MKKASKEMVDALGDIEYPQSNFAWIAYPGYGVSNSSTFPTSSATTVRVAGQLVSSNDEAAIYSCNAPLSTFYPTLNSPAGGPIYEQFAITTTESGDVVTDEDYGQIVTPVQSGYAEAVAAINLCPRCTGIDITPPGGYVCDACGYPGMKHLHGSGEPVPSTYAKRNVCMHTSLASRRYGGGYVCLQKQGMFACGAVLPEIPQDGVARIVDGQGMVGGDHYQHATTGDRRGVITRAAERLGANRFTSKGKPPF